LIKLENIGYTPIGGLDILMSSSHDYLAFVRPMREALRFLFANDTDLSAIAKTSFKYFPCECSEFFINSWSSLREGLRRSLLESIPRRLRYVGNDEVHGLWCDLFVRQGTLFDDPTFGATVDFLVQMTGELLLTSKHRTWDLHVKLATFLIRKSGPVVIQFLQGLSPVERCAFLNEAPLVLAFLREAGSELLDDYSPAVPPVVPDPLFPELPNLPKDDSEIQIAFEAFARYANLEMTKAVLEIAAQRKVSVDISNAALPEGMIGPIAEVLAKTQPNTLDGMQALRLARTSWRPLALARLRSGTGELLENLLTCEKLPKMIILGLCSVVGFVHLDPILLFSLAMQLFYSSASSHRFYLTTALLGTVLGAADSFTSGLLEPFFRVVAESMELMFLPILGRIFAAIANLTEVNPSFCSFVQKLLPLCGNKTIPAGHLHQALIASPISNLPPIAEIVGPYLTSVMPSLYLTGLRLFVQAITSLPPEKLVVGLRVPLEVIADRFIRMSSYPSIADMHSRTVTTLLEKANIGLLQGHLFKMMPQRVALPSESGGFVEGCRFWPLALRTVTSSSDFGRFLGFCGNLLQSPGTFDIGLRCLKVRLLKAKGRRESVLIDSVRGWLTDLTLRQDYHTLDRIVGWFDFINVFDSKLLPVLSTELLKVKRPAQFVIIFSGMTKVLAKYRNNEEVTGTIRRVAASLDMKCRQNSVLLLERCCDWRTLLPLARFEKDCPESEKLTASLNGAKE
jgi:hypothetical protein